MTSPGTFEANSTPLNAGRRHLGDHEQRGRRRAGMKGVARGGGWMRRGPAVECGAWGARRRPDARTSGGGQPEVCLMKYGDLAKSRNPANDCEELSTQFAH